MLDEKKNDAKMVENIKRKHFSTICKWTPGSIEYNVYEIT